MQIFVAAIPIAAILILMVGFKWSGSSSGGAGYLLAIVLSVLFFGATWPVILNSQLKAILLALDVLLIIWAAYILFKVSEEAEAIKAIGLILPRITEDKTLQALIIGWGFASFLQGIGGFGVPVAVIAPILISLGFSPISAVILPSVGHGWAVTFGSLGSSFNALMATTMLDSKLLAPPAAAMLGIAALISGLMIAFSIEGSGKRSRYILPVTFAASAMGIVQYLVAVAGLWNIAAFSGAIAGLLVLIPIARTRSKNAALEKGEVKTLIVSLIGYISLVAIILIVQFTPGMKTLLGSIQIKFLFPEIATTLGYRTPAGPGRIIPVLTHAGTMLLAASAVGFIIFSRLRKYQTGAASRILSQTWHSMGKSSISILAMVSMAVLMEHTGMTGKLASGMAEGFQSIYPVIAPWIGALGAFITGSNTNSNVVFGGLQLQTAQLLGLSAPIILAGQTAGAGLASILAPTKVIVGAATAGLAGREGEIMRRLIVYGLILVGLISALTVIGIALFSPR